MEKRRATYSPQRPRRTQRKNKSCYPHLDLNRKHLDVRGCWGSDYSHFHRAVELLRSPAAGKLWSAISGTRYTLSQADQAVDDVAAGRVIKAIMVPTA